MSRLFISVYLDEDVSTLIAELLKHRGCTALTARDAGQLHRSDAEQLTFAAAQQMAILTHNRKHFEELGRQWLATGRTHCGIIIAVRRLPHEIARRLAALIDQTTADEMDNQVLYV